MKIVACFLLLTAASLAAEPSTRPATTRSSRDPNEIRRGMEMGGDPQERARRSWENMIRKIEPTLHGDVSRIDQYVELFKRECVEDTRTFAFDVHGTFADGRATLNGFVEFPEHKEAIKQFFKYLNLPGVEDQTELLPSTSLGDRKFGFITAVKTFVYDKPDVTSRREALTQCLQGEMVYLLKETGDSLLVHAPSGYVGYVASKDIRRMSELAIDQFDAALPVKHPERIEAVIAEASKMMGTPYVWSGITKEGIDCSGLVYTAFKAVNIQMPRDADQQYLVGRLVGTRWHRSGLHRGDTLYFLGRRGTIHHTAIYLGDNKYIEAADPGVKITSFDPKDKEYSEGRDKSFCFAKRVIE